ncbi:MAG: toxic anion resistance protein [Deltaproteobacteria bacterium]|jgi:uncharacterized protein YaaN involved in tellurite resistance|nr:toxic anion resistance protein [Deltaproteobacteria bacterium]
MADDAPFSLEKLDLNKVAEDVKEETALPPAQIDPIKETAEKNAQIIMDLDPSSEDKRSNVLALMENFGKTGIKTSGETNQFLKASVGELTKAGEEGGIISKGLLDLENQINDLNPSKVDFLRKGIFAKIFNPITKYFNRYKKSESIIANILDTLEKGKQTLISDNENLKGEQSKLREATLKLKKDFEMGDLMDKAISSKVEAPESSGDPEKISFIKEEILFPLRQKLQDIQQMQTVNQQGIIAMEVIQRNNNELVRGVDRAKNVTVNALRISITVASALYNQKITLEKIKALNTTTENLIAQTSTMLKEQGAEIHKQASSSTISVDVLKKSFTDALESMDEIKRYKMDALPKMKETISQFQTLTEKGEEVIQKMEKGDEIARKRGFIGQDGDSPPQLADSASASEESKS